MSDLLPVFLSIGIVATKGEENNLMQALNSLTRHTSATEYSDLVIVVVFEGDSNAALLQRIKSDFGHELDKGLIQVIHPTGEFYGVVNREPLGWGGLTFTDDFKKNTMEFNKRLCFLFEYCFQMSKHYLHLTDQTRAIKSYLPVIKQVVNNIEEKNVSFYSHDFGANSLPSLGRLYSAEVAGDLAEYAALFPGGLLPHTIIDIHAGMRMSQRLTHQDGGQFLFKMATELRGVKPEAKFKITCTCEGGHEIEKAFNEEYDFAWLKTPKMDDKVTLEFKEPFEISRVLITTGSPLFRDMMINGVLLVCGTNKETNTCDDSQCKKIGHFRDPILDVRNLETAVSFSVKCLKIHIIADIKRWVIIREISVWPR